MGICVDIICYTFYDARIWYVRTRDTCPYDCSMPVDELCPVIKMDKCIIMSGTGSIFFIIPCSVDNKMIYILLQPNFQNLHKEHPRITCRIVF